MSATPLAEEVLSHLLQRGLTEVEVLTKRGRSRRLELGGAAPAASFVQERGWAVRAGDRRGSFFAAGTGEPEPGGPWPAAYGPALRLPGPEEEAPAWKQPSDFEAPLVGEREGLALLEGLGRELAAELPRARLVRAVLEDGSSEGELASSRGIRARFRQRLAALHLEALGPGPDGPAASLYLAEREARRFAPRALARRLADRLSVAAAGPPPDGPAEPGEAVLAPPLAARLLAGLAPLFAGPRASAQLAALADGRGRIAGEAFTLVDDGRLPGGAFESPVDGEGVPTREVVLVERGLFRQPLLAWWQARGAHARTSGCSRRASWRDLPVPGPTHLYLRPDPKTPPAALLGAVARGHYLLDATGPGRLDLEAGRFAFPVCGFVLEGGRASAPIGRAWLCAEVRDLLQGVVAAGRDLAFLPLDGMIGSPTLLVHGLEVRAGGHP